MYNNFPVGFGTLNMSSGFTILIFVFALWSIFWKGWALWRAARNNSTGWFIALLIINTIGILEIIYIFGLSGFGKKEVVKIVSKDEKKEEGDEKEKDSK